MGSSNVSLSANIQICSRPELADEVHMMSCTFKFRTRYHVLIDINSSARIHDNCTVWEHDSAWNHVGILGFLLQNFFKEEDATKLSIVHGGDVCTLHGLNSCQCKY